VEGICGDMIKYRLLLLLDIFLEAADGVCSRYLDGEYVTGIITEYETVKLEDGMI
jgi:hypothetical protein